MKKINIEQIMDEIREDIKKKNISENIIDFEDVEYDNMISDLLETDNLDFNYDEYRESIIYLKDNYEVQAWRYYQSINFIQKIKNFIKKVMRKLTKSYVEPIVNDQNKINKNVYEAFSQLNAKIYEDKCKIKTLENRIEKLEKALLEKN